MHLLYIDDDIEDLELFSDAIKLIDANHRCVMTSDCDEGLSMIHASHPDVIFLDVNMPKMDGKDLLKRIRSDKSLASIKVCMLSTAMTPRDAARYLKMGANHCLRKPESFEALMNTLRALFIDECAKVNNHRAL